MSQDLRILQATAWYPPDHIGGTEVYLEGLVDALAQTGIASTVLRPRAHAEAMAYRHNGAEVLSYFVNDRPSEAELRDLTPPAAFAEFRALLEQQQGAIYHQHSWTRGCGPRHLQAAKAMGFPTVLTVHVPGNLCMRGTMMRFGETACDGRVEEEVCSACWAQSRGLPRWTSGAVARVPLLVGRQARRRSGRLATVLAARVLVEERLKEIAGMLAHADRIVAVCHWLYEALAANGVPRERLVLNRQGLSAAFLQSIPVALNHTSDAPALRLAYVGRWDAAKGVDVAVRAVKSLPSTVAAHLTIHAISGTGEAAEYERIVRRLTAGETRITIAGPLNRNEISYALPQYDGLVIPSQWMETGPMVALEAQACGVFVIGSRLGGIAELVEEGEDGMLVPPGNVAAWAQAISTLEARWRAAGLSRTRRRVRTMAAVASDMALLYKSLDRGAST